MPNNLIKLDNGKYLCNYHFAIHAFTGKDWLEDAKKECDGISINDSGACEKLNKILMESECGFD